MKKLLVLWIILGLAVCIGPLAADTADGFSNVFGIDNTKGSTRIAPSSSWPGSPYDNAAPWDLLRGQLHCHKRSDLPLNSPVWMHPAVGEAELAQRYRNAGFDFVAVTEHNEVSGESIGWEGWAPHSDELTFNEGHILVAGSNANTSGQLDSGSFSQDKVGRLVQRINTATQLYSGLAFIAHPDSVPYSISPNEICSIYNRSWPDGLAIYNSSWPGKNSEGTWDEVMSTSRWPVRGFAEEDYHPYMGGVHKIGSAWVAVPNTSTWWGNIKDKLRAGNFYSYWVEGGAWTEGNDPPRLRVTVNGSGSHPVITAELRDSAGNPYSAGSIRFIGPWGNTLMSASGSTATCPTGGWERYVRVRVSSALSGWRTLNIASQPIYINASGMMAISTTKFGITATTPELHLTYLQPSEYPEARPAAGYIGQAFDVTTDSGTCPPGATLDLSYDGEDLSALGGTQYLAIYRYDTIGKVWAKVGGTVDPGTAIITSPISTLGYYTISADLPADTTAPEVFIDNPPFGGSVSVDTQVRATVNDDLGAYQVSFYMNDHPLAVDTDALDGWSVNLPYADYCTGDWTLKAVAEDLAGNQGTAEIPIYISSTTPKPTVSITSPTGGANLSGTVTATGTCGDDVAVAAVTLYADDTLVGYGELDGSGGWTAEIDTTYLADGARALKAVVEDYPGNEATATVSVNISNGMLSIGSLKDVADGQIARLGNAVVTAGTGEMNGAFYVEAANRSAGIRVSTDKVVPEGAQVTVAGALGTLNGERQITASDVFVESTGNELPDPLGTVGRSFKVGLDNTGLLVRVWGTITATPEGSGYFYVDDGSNLQDGSGNIGIKVCGTPPADPVGKRVSVTGISGAELEGETPIPVIRTRRAEDVTEQSSGS